MMTESEIQKAIIAWAKMMEKKYPELELLHHIPNGGKRNPREAKSLKDQGVKRGVPDLCLPVPSGGFHGLYVELKASKGRLTPDQKAWASRLTQMGYKWCCCRSVQEAIKTIEDYLND